MHRVLFILILLMSLAGCRQVTEPDGRQAKTDARQAGAEAAGEAIERGEPLRRLEYPPLPYPPGHNIYTDLLKERCQVEWEIGRPGDMAEDIYIQHVQGWNSAVEEEIRKRFGPSIMEDLYQEAQQIFQQQRDAPRPPGS
ncbi:MAG: hypothetical protein QGH11_08120 [Pirellulaceae bacterium]|nr:hypothetical protein [Pirellulaceae bacterium]